MNAKPEPVSQKKSKGSLFLLKLFGLLLLLAILVALFSRKAGAQEQAGSVEIAEAVEPVVSTALDKSVECVVKLKTVGASFKEAKEFCKDVVTRTTRMAEGGWNSAQKAAQASRPIVMSNGYYPPMVIATGTGVAYGTNRYYGTR
ncbi:hypothetical protein A2640_01840 [Candidatus Nomurabacteria bacterium RIFCSPHIGHO2_01_FULL_36_23]|nr:MAG: hypothetical protein A2640_01840 [Candidatus Nomurabacteria bacterium RIFCSPHIGHO2_01_FULL_36_23]